MSEKTTHFGRAGEFYAMSELLLRGWNVAVPVVDVGDDVFVIDDNEKEPTGFRSNQLCLDNLKMASFGDFQTFTKPVEVATCHRALLHLSGSRRRSMEIRRHLARKLAALRERVEMEPRPGAGRPTLTDNTATTDALSLTIILGERDATAWGMSLNDFLDQWPADLPSFPHGPGVRMPPPRST